MASFLVVDDEPLSVDGLSQLLREDGHEVAPFTAGADAVDALARGSFDAVVTDLEMPHVDGHAVVQATRRHNPRACLVVVTATDERDCQHLIDAGACFIADKPFEYAHVARTIDECRAAGGAGAHGRCHLRSRPHGEVPTPLRRK